MSLDKHIKARENASMICMTFERVKLVIHLGVHFTEQDHPEADIVFPENGLHPSKRWGHFEWLVRGAAKRVPPGQPVRVVTHDQAIIAALSEAVAFGLVDLKLVEIHLHSEDDSVQVVHYREDGSIDGWPTGFFSAGSITDGMTPDEYRGLLAGTWPASVREGKSA